DFERGVVAQLDEPWGYIQQWAPRNEYVAVGRIGYHAADVRLARLIIPQLPRSLRRVTEAIPVLEIGLVLLIAGVVGVLARRVGRPAVVGYHVVGLLVGPVTPAYVADKHETRVLADVAVVLLRADVRIALGPRP